MVPPIAANARAHAPPWPAAVHAARQDPGCPASPAAIGDGQRHRAIAGKPTNRASEAASRSPACRRSSRRCCWGSPAPTRAAGVRAVQATRHTGRPTQRLVARRPRAARKRAWRSPQALPTSAMQQQESASVATQGGKARMRSTSIWISPSSEVSWPMNQCQSLSSSISRSRRKTPRSASELCRQARSR